MQMVVDVILSPELGDLSGMNFITKFIIVALTLSSEAFQLGIIVFFVYLILKVVIRKQDFIEDLLNKFVTEYQIRRVFTIVFVTVVFFSVIIIRTLERFSWLDAIYYVVITISTVGFGDVTATHPISKLVTMLLILNGITFIGLASQMIIDRIVNLQLSRQNSLPSEPLDLENHIIIAGYGSKGRRLAQLFLERGYKVIVVEIDEDRARLAEYNGFHSLTGDITKPALLEILSLNKCAGLFILLSDDNLVIQTGIIARSIASDIDIYGEFLSVPTYNIARYAGINKPISLFVFLTNELQSFFNRPSIELLQSLRELRTQETSLGFIQVPINFDYEGMFENPLVIGEVSRGLNEIYLDAHLSIEYEKPPLHTTHILIAVDREELDQKLKIDAKELNTVERLIFAGYSDMVDSLIERLEFPKENIIVLWHNPEFQEQLQQKQYKKYQWSLENGHLLLEQIVKDGDLIICSFDDITSSLILGVTLNNLRKAHQDKEDNGLQNTQLIQFVPYEYDIEPLMKVGAEVVFTPQQIMSSAILGIFLKENNLSPSLVYTNGHLYEHLVIEDDFFHKRTAQSLRYDKYNVLFVRKATEEYFYKVNNTYQLESGDRVLIFIKNKQKERLDRLI